MADDWRWKPVAFVKREAASEVVHRAIKSRPELLDNAVGGDAHGKRAI
jgi:hypothetical protein